MPRELEASQGALNGQRHAGSPDMTLTRVAVSREIYQERERLKESRNSLLTAAAQPAAAQPLAGAAPDDAALQLQQDPQQLQQPGAERRCSVWNAAVQTRICLQILWCAVSQARNSGGRDMESTAYSLTMAVWVVAAMAGGAAPEADAQQQWQVPAWDPTDGGAAEHDPDHVEVRPPPPRPLGSPDPACLDDVAEQLQLMHTCRRMLACTVMSCFPSLHALHTVLLRACQHHAAHAN